MEVQSEGITYFTDFLFVPKFCSLKLCPTWILHHHWICIVLLPERLLFFLLSLCVVLFVCPALPHHCTCACMWAPRMVLSEDAFARAPLTKLYAPQGTAYTIPVSGRYQSILCTDRQITSPNRFLDHGKYKLLRSLLISVPPLEL